MKSKEGLIKLGFVKQDESLVYPINSDMWLQYSEDGLQLMFFEVSGGMNWINLYPENIEDVKRLIKMLKE